MTDLRSKFVRQHTSAAIAARAAGLRWNPMPTPVNPILLYDGVCGLCNRLVQFTLRHDHANLFRFASLQSPLAIRILQQHGANPADLNSFYVVVQAQQPEEQLFARSDAVAYVLGGLGGRWQVWGTLWKRLPRGVRDALYNLVARNRYKIFGKLDTCPLPDPGYRSRFLDI
jgi:predicted DCC family thiol-disulfide oxidoreductase YuxK